MDQANEEYREAVKVAGGLPFLRAFSMVARADTGPFDPFPAESLLAEVNLVLRETLGSTGSKPAHLTPSIADENKMDEG
jgi:hypothetical protein